jgi:glycosyltransferase involved in cell wall biosynthesis
VSAEITAIVLTFNEADLLPACLSSLREVASKIVIVDSGSTDATLRIAQQYGAQVVHHPFENYAAQRNWALRTLDVSDEWVLNVDADERLTPELSSAIRTALMSDAVTATAGYMFSRRVIFMRRWIKWGGIYPTYHLRLFRRGAGRCEQRLYDQHFIVEGACVVLNGDLIEESRDLRTFVSRHTAWASAEANELAATAPRDVIQGNRNSQNPIERRRWQREVYQSLPILLRPFIFFFYRYVIRLGFLDGIAGLLYHLIQGFWFRLMIDFRLLQVRRRRMRALV